MSNWFRFGVFAYIFEVGRVQERFQVTYRNLPAEVPQLLCQTASSLPLLYRTSEIIRDSILCFIAWKRLPRTTEGIQTVARVQRISNQSVRANACKGRKELRLNENQPPDGKRARARSCNLGLMCPAVGGPEGSLALTRISQLGGERWKREKKEYLQQQEGGKKQKR